MKLLISFLLPILAVVLTSCATHFSAAHSKEVTPDQFVAIYHVEPLDQMLYQGSDSEYHYFFRARPLGAASLKIKKSGFHFPGEFQIAGGSNPVLVKGRFDQQTATWIQK